MQAASALILGRKHTTFMHWQLHRHMKWEKRLTRFLQHIRLALNNRGRRQIWWARSVHRWMQTRKSRYASHAAATLGFVWETLTTKPPPFFFLETRTCMVFFFELVRCACIDNCACPPLYRRKWNGWLAWSLDRLAVMMVTGSSKPMH